MGLQSATETVLLDHSLVILILYLLSDNDTYFTLSQLFLQVAQGNAHNFFPSPVPILC